MLSCVSFGRPSERRLAANMQSGGSSQNTLKKLKGAALTTPDGPTVVTHAIGRGSTNDASTLYRSRGFRSAGGGCMGVSRGGGSLRERVRGHPPPTPPPPAGEGARPPLLPARYFNFGAPC